jgi:hypothetical protein
MTKSMDMEYIHILMEDHIKVNGQMENNMVKASLLLLKVLKEKEYGMKVKELDGLMIMKTIIMRMGNE